MCLPNQDCLSKYERFTLFRFPFKNLCCGELIRPECIFYSMDCKSKGGKISVHTCSRWVINSKNQDTLYTRFKRKIKTPNSHLMHNAGLEIVIVDFFTSSSAATKLREAFCTEKRRSRNKRLSSSQK